MRISDWSSDVCSSDLDSAQVFIEFPAGIGQGEIPPLFVIGPNGGGELVNYRVRERYIVVDRLFSAAELRLGKHPKQTVRIVRDDGHQRGGARRCAGMVKRPEGGGRYPRRPPTQPRQQ